MWIGTLARASANYFLGAGFVDVYIYDFSHGLAIFLANNSFWFNSLFFSQLLFFDFYNRDSLTIPDWNGIDQFLVESTPALVLIHRSKP